jgi:hypothetical protein
VVSFTAMTLIGRGKGTMIPPGYSALRPPGTDRNPFGPRAHPQAGDATVLA